MGKIPWRKEWLPTPVLLFGEFHGQRCPVGYRPWGHKESDMTYWLNHHHTYFMAEKEHLYLRMKSENFSNQAQNLSSHNEELNYTHNSVQFSHWVVSDSLRPHESQHARPPVHHHPPEFTETHVHQVSDAIQPSHPLSSSSPPAPNPSQHQSLFQWVNSSHEVAKELEFQL